MSEKVYKQTFEVPVPARVSLRNIRGEVTVRPALTGQLAVTAVQCLNDSDPDSTEVEMWQAKNGSVFIATRHKKLLGAKACRVDYEVQLPVPCKLTLRSNSGATFLEQLRDGFRVKMVSEEPITNSV